MTLSRFATIMTGIEPLCTGTVPGTRKVDFSLFTTHPVPQTGLEQRGSSFCCMSTVFVAMEQTNFYTVRFLHSTEWIILLNGKSDRKHSSLILDASPHFGLQDRA